MTPQAEIEYTLAREVQERMAAEEAAGDAARDFHRELADRYADRAWGMREANCCEGNAC